MLNRRHHPTFVTLWAALFPVCLVLPGALQAASMSEVVAKAKQEGAAGGSARGSGDHVPHPAGPDTCVHPMRL